MAINSVITHTQDLSGPLTIIHLRHHLVSEDNRGDRFRVTVTNNGESVDLSGAGVTAYFVRCGDNYTVPVTGSVSGNTASVTLTEACYAVPGRFTLTVKLNLDNVRHAVAVWEGAVLRASTDAIIDPGHAIPSLDELLAQIAQIESATKNANNAAAYIKGTTVSATQVAAGGRPTVSASDTDGHLHLAFGLVKGDKGDPGDITNLTVNGAKVGSGNNVDVRKILAANGADVAAFSSGDNYAGVQLHFPDGSAAGAIRYVKATPVGNGHYRLQALNPSSANPATIYTSDDPPKATDVGAVATVNGATGDGVGNVNIDKLIASGGGVIALVSGDNYAMLRFLFASGDIAGTLRFAKTIPVGNDHYRLQVLNPSGGGAATVYTSADKPRASDVGARPDTWMPTAKDVGALVSVNGAAGDNSGNVNVTRLASSDGGVTAQVTGTNYIGLHFAFGDGVAAGALRYAKGVAVANGHYRLQLLNPSNASPATVYTSADPPPAGTSAASAIAFVTMAQAGLIDAVTAAEHAELFEAWAENAPCRAGQLKRYEGALYRCLQDHTAQPGWAPDKAPALWALAADPAEAWPAWSQPIGAGDAYQTGDQVSHQGKRWVSAADGNVWEPGVYGWEEAV